MIDNMARALGPNEPTEPEAWNGDIPATGEGTEHVRVVTDAFSVQAISIHDMPHEHVMQMLILTEPFKQVKQIALFKLAVKAEDEDQLELLSYYQIWQGTSAWIEASNRYHSGRMKDKKEKMATVVWDS